MPRSPPLAETTAISWADATLNFWIGCTEVSNGPKGACESCYARRWGARFGVTWGVGEARRKSVGVAAKARRLEKLAIAKAARGEGAFLCFVNSLSDIFDKEVPVEWLAEAFATMRATPHVTYLLLTKRAPNIIGRAKAAGGLPKNVAIGATVVTQPEADRDVLHLLIAKEELEVAIAFLSLEPLQGYIDLRRIRPPSHLGSEHPLLDALLGRWTTEIGAPYGLGASSWGLDWVIAGGESGPHARPSHPDWFRDLAGQCAETGVPFHFKQWGEWTPGENVDRQTGALTGAYVSEGGSCHEVRFTARESQELHHDDEPQVWRVGRSRAGRLLDGVLYDARPEVV